MIGISELTKSRFLVRIDNVEVEVSGYEMGHLEAAEEAALTRWKWLQGNVNSIEMVERVGDWRMFRIHYTRDGQPSSGRVAVCQLRA